MEHEVENLIIGAGPAGLAVAGRLGRLGVPYTVLERADRVAPAWHGHYDRLHLHTVKRYSALPHLPFPDDVPTYVPRAQVVAYYERYAREMEITPRFDREVVAVERQGSRWRTTTATGETYGSDAVVVATGFNRKPHLPTWEGQADFEGSILHSSRYKNGAPYVGRRVLVVGMGNSGAEIALDLYEHGAIPALSVRGPVNIVPRDLLGRPTQRTAMLLSRLPTPVADLIGVWVRSLAVGDLSEYGIETPRQAPAAQLRLRAKTPVIDVGTVPLIKSGRVKVLPAVRAFRERSVVFIDGRELPFDAVVLATGFRPAIEDIVQDAGPFLDGQGIPRFGDPAAVRQGLFFVGFDAYSNGLLWRIHQESEVVAEHLRARQE